MSVEANSGVAEIPNRIYRKIKENGANRTLAAKVWKWLNYPDSPNEGIFRKLDLHRFPVVWGWMNHWGMPDGYGSYKHPPGIRLMVVPASLQEAFDRWDSAAGCLPSCGANLIHCEDRCKCWLPMHNLDYLKSGDEKCLETRYSWEAGEYGWYPPYGVAPCTAMDYPEEILLTYAAARGPVLVIPEPKLARKVGMFDEGWLVNLAKQCGLGHPTKKQLYLLSYIWHTQRVKHDIYSSAEIISATNALTVSLYLSEGKKLESLLGGKW